MQPMTPQKSPKGAILRDVAAAAGVDISTVSKVLNGADRISVRPETRERILKAVDKLGYHPNANARGLRMKRTGVIGLLLPNITNPVYATIVRGAVRQAEQLGYSLLLAELGQKTDSASYRRLVLEKRIDGLLIATARGSNAFTHDLQRSNIPFILVNRRVDRSEAACVIVDDESGARLAANTLLRLGHRRVGVVGGPSDIDTANRRLEGFRSVVEKVEGATLDVFRAPYTPTGGYEAATHLLSQSRRPTALFVSNFFSAIGALAAAVDLKRNVPNDLSMIAFDGAAIADFTRPSITTVMLPLEEMGERAVSTLHDLIVTGRHCGTSVVDSPPKLIERGSHSKASTISCTTKAIR